MIIFARHYVDNKEITEGAAGIPPFWRDEFPMKI